MSKAKKGLETEAQNRQYLFVSKRLGFRPYQENDFENFYALDNDPDVRKYLEGNVPSIEQAKERIQKHMQNYKNKGFSGFVTFELATGEFIGRSGFREMESGEIEVGYVFAKKFWGKGFATEALNRLLEWAKENIQIDTIIAYAIVDHKASLRVMEKCGMTYYKNQMMNGEECAFYKKDLKS
jgi:ribosomal-protein-alanine N-acetyltransferase